jgi:ferredoxin
LRFIDRSGFAQLLTELLGRGYQLIGPTVRDGAIRLEPIEGIEDLPAGIGVEQGPGAYRLVRRDDDRLFDWAQGPDSGKSFLFPARELLGVARKDDGHLEFNGVGDPVPRYAFIGMRACDLCAIAIQDRVFLGAAVQDASYASRRESAFIVGVDCAQPGDTCFCASMGTGPRCMCSFDLALTELDGGFLVRVGSTAGEDLLAAVASREAGDEEAAEARAIVRKARARMRRSVDPGGLPDLLSRNREHPRWEEIAERCLACGNCTSVCPTCFCHDIVDEISLDGTEARRTREWASCFSEEFSHVVGGSVRTTHSSRYRQWLTHKFAGWVEQFGTSGCVGCGRCITWCPVGIDITEELAAIRASDGMRVEVGG